MANTTDPFIDAEIEKLVRNIMLIRGEPIEPAPRPKLVVIEGGKK